MNNILLFGKIAGKSFLGWLKIIMTGGLVSIICLITGIVLWGNNEGAGFAGSKAGFIGALIGVLMLFVIEFWTALLFFGTIVCMCLYIPMASRYGIKKAIYLTWRDKLGDILVTRADQYLARIMERKGFSAKQAITPEDATLLKKEMMAEAKKDPETNKIQKNILQYLLKRINMHDINFSAPPAEIRTAILRKFKEMISEKIQPSMQAVWIMVAAQVIVLIIAVICDHH